LGNFQAGFREQTKKIGGGGIDKVFIAEAAQARYLLSDVLHVTRLVGFPTVGHRREVGRVGFNQ
jgi:hypothetical protein